MPQSLKSTLNTLQGVQKETKKSLNKRVEAAFKKFAEYLSNVVGSPYWFAFSLLLILIWLPSKFFIKSPELWHLLINSTTTVLTFLMMSLLHSSQKQWEDRMENLQKREKTDIKTIKDGIVPPNTGSQGQGQRQMAQDKTSKK